MSDIFKDYSFGGMFREFRVKNEITLRLAASMLKLDVGNLSKMERSELSPPRTAQKIEQYGKRLRFTDMQIGFLQQLAFSHHTGALQKEFWMTP